MLDGTFLAVRTAYRDDCNEARTATAIPSKVAPGPPGDGKPHVVLARKYRPSTFANLIGQEPMVRTLKNAFQSSRIAQAYMFTGVNDAL